MGPGDPTSPDRSGYPVTFFPGTTSEAGGAAIHRYRRPDGRRHRDGAVADHDRADRRHRRRHGRHPIGNSFRRHVVDRWDQLDRRTDGHGRRHIHWRLSRRATTSSGRRQRRRTRTSRFSPTVGSEDITGLRLVALPPATVSGRIVVDPSMTPPSAAFSLVALPDDQVMPGGPTSAVVADDLTFELTATPGRNRTSRSIRRPAGRCDRSASTVSTSSTTDRAEAWRSSPASMSR